MRATVLVDNIAGSELLCGEWGLSVYIEHQGHVVLLDTGASDLFARNAAALGLDLAAVELGVLSHAHYDHADGMEAFFAANAGAKFYLRAGSRENCFAYHGESLDYIGIRRGTLERFRDRIEYVSGLYELYPGAWLLPHTMPDLASLGEKAEMVLDADIPGRRRPDDFAHEQTLVLEGDDGLAVFSSCSHGGVMNILREVKETFPHKRITALVGGFHLFKSAPEEVHALATELRSAGVAAIFTGHCTGEDAYDILKEALGEGVSQMRTGLTVEIP